MSNDNTVRLWACDDWDVKVILNVRCPHTVASSVVFSPDSEMLAIVDNAGHQIRIWSLEKRLLRARHGAIKALRYSSAKIVLVGESNVGKSCLAMRLAENRYPDDHEHGTTHGMRFWQMDAEKLHPAAKPPEGHRRDVILWDFGGQAEYQLVHQMFLHDTTLALVLIDPTRGRAAYDQAREWNKRLEKQLVRYRGNKDRPVKILVGAKVDRSTDLVDPHAIEALRDECGFAAYVDMSAKTGRNVDTLRKLIADAVDWNQMAKTSRPELFQRIRDEIDVRRRSDEVVVLLDDLITIMASEHPIKPAQSAEASTALIRELRIALVAVSEQLATQGVIAKTTLMRGDEALVLQVPVIERYAGALIIAARNNPRGVPVLEERLLGET
jgi:small GTP-binding protein